MSVIQYLQRLKLDLQNVKYSVWGAGRRIH